MCREHLLTRAGGDGETGDGGGRRTEETKKEQEDGGDEEGTGGRRRRRRNRKKGQKRQVITGKREANVESLPHARHCICYDSTPLKVQVTQSCPILCDPIDCSLPGSSVCRILQARLLEWVAISFSRGSAQPRD